MLISDGNVTSNESRCRFYGWCGHFRFSQSWKVLKLSLWSLRTLRPLLLLLEDRYRRLSDLRLHQYLCRLAHDALVSVAVPAGCDVLPGPEVVFGSGLRLGGSGGSPLEADHFSQSLSVCRTGRPCYPPDFSTRPKDRFDSFTGLV